jgi:obg-like ATPase 1
MWVSLVDVIRLGKSTTFNVLCKLNVPAENYPFCTIDPNTAKVLVPDERFDKLCKMFKPKSEVAAVLSIVDIAGLLIHNILGWSQEPIRVKVSETHSCRISVIPMPFFK